MGCIIANNFNLLHTLESGQFFRYEKDGSSYLIACADRFFRVRQSGNKLFFDGVDKKYVLQFFSLTSPISRVLKAINKDKYMNEAIKRYKGLRLIRQDPWECLVSYVVSANSNIPRIKANVAAIAKAFGQFKGTHYAFPRPGHINSLSLLKKCGVGYRAKYLFELNGLVDEEWLSSLRGMAYADAKKALMRLPGVGAKVADCVLLFAFGFTEAFPMDTWVTKAMKELYFPRKRVTPKKIGLFASEYFGKHAGLAQQYLFHWRRNAAREVQGSSLYA